MTTPEPKVQTSALIDREYHARRRLLREVIDALVKNAPEPKHIAQRTLYLALALQTDSMLMTSKAEVARMLGISEARVGVGVKVLDEKIQWLLGSREEGGLGIAHKTGIRV